MPDKKGRPFRELFDHFAEMQRMREYARHPGEAGGEPRTHDTAWVPTTDIFAHDDDLVIRCELAGVEPDDVEISLSRGVLLIWGERDPRPDQADDVSYYVHERRFGAFRRSITLPERVTQGPASARRWRTACSRSSSSAARPRTSIERIEIAQARRGAACRSTSSRRRGER